MDADVDHLQNLLNSLNC